MQFVYIFLNFPAWSHVKDHRNVPPSPITQYVVDVVERTDFIHQVSFVCKATQKKGKRRILLLSDVHAHSDHEVFSTFLSKLVGHLPASM